MDRREKREDLGVRNCMKREGRILLNERTKETLET